MTKSTAIVILVFVALAMVCCSKHLVSSPLVIYPGNSGIEYIGRWEKRDSANYISHWGGAYFRLQFTGSSITVNLANNPGIRTYIDDGPGIKSSGSFSATGLRPGTHTFVMAANFQSDEIWLKSIQLDDTAIIIPPGSRREIIEFVGNSLTVGGGVSSCQLAYPWLVAEALGYDHTQIAYGGITLVEGYPPPESDLKHGQIKEYFALREPLNDLKPAFNFTDYTPAMIVIELGANDRQRDVPLDYFKQQYVIFIQEIREKYPAAKIVLVTSAFCRSEYGEGEMKDVTEILNKRGDDRVYFISSRNWLTNDDLVDGCHPSAEGNQRMADSLKPRLADILAR